MSPGEGEESLNKIQKMQSMKKRCMKSTMKTEDFVFIRRNHRMRGVATSWGKIFIIHITKKWFIFKVYKEFLLFKQKR